MIVFESNRASADEIKNHLAAFYGLLFGDTAMDINAYAEKIYHFAFTGEAWCDGELIGLIACYLNNTASHEGFITHVGVMEEFQNTGVAGSLLNVVMRQAAENAFEKITLEVNCKNRIAVSFYQKHGFSIVNQGETIYTMSRMLPSLPDGKDDAKGV